MEIDRSDRSRGLPQD